LIKIGLTKEESRYISNMDKIQYNSCDLDEIQVGEPLPVSIYVHLNLKFITYRAKGDCFDRNDYDRFMQKKVRDLFIKRDDYPAFSAWSQKFKEEEKENVILPNIQLVKADAHRKMMDIFHSKHPDKIVAQSIEVSKKLVLEVMKDPLVYHKINSLQSYSKGTVDHCVNVAVLSTYLGMKMGYSHHIILKHLGTGALLHDLGKGSIQTEDSDSPSMIEEKMKAHPLVGRKILEKNDDMPEEVLKIVEQHHECFDGSGYPHKIKGNNIYDLARIVAIANSFDELVGNGKGTLQQRQTYALGQLEYVICKKFDPSKLEKCLKILKLGI
jgi:putative nucleotidyltransferase with HDIG domain